MDSARICFTCHNFEYQGTASVSELASCGLDAYQLNRPDRMQDNSAHDRINLVKVYNTTTHLFYQHHSSKRQVSLILFYFLYTPIFQGAIVFSNIVTTVSPTYAQEVQTAEVRYLRVTDAVN